LQKIAFFFASNLSYQALPKNGVKGLVSLHHKNGMNNSTSLQLSICFKKDYQVEY